MYSSSRGRRYSKSEIAEILFRVKSGELSVIQARRIYGIGGKMTIYRWLERHDSTIQKQQSYKMTRKKVALKEPNKDLELESVQLRLEYYETIFALAKEEYGVDFKKILGPRSRDVIKDEENNEPVSDSVKKPSGLL